MVYKLYSGHDFVIETATYKVQRGITQKIYIQELWFLCSARRPMLVNIYMKISWMVFKLQSGHDFVMDRHRWTDGQTTRAKTICLPTLKGET